MSLYTRARKHIDMDRVKELREEKIKREQIAKLVQEQEKIRAELEYIEAEESKYINWRRDLENLDIIDEGMTSSDMFLTTLQDTGDTVNVKSPPSGSLILAPISFDWILISTLIFPLVLFSE